MTLLLFHCSAARFPALSPGHCCCASTIIISSYRYFSSSRHTPRCTFKQMRLTIHHCLDSLVVLWRINPSVQFMIVYNNELEEGDDTLFPLYAEYEDTRLILLSVSYRTGQALRQYIAEKPEAVRQQQGGPLIVISEVDNLPPQDSPSPTGMSTAEVIEEIGWGILAFLVALAVPCAFVNCALTALICATRAGLLLLHKQVALPRRTLWLMMVMHVGR